MATERNFDKLSVCIMKDFEQCGSIVKECYGKVRAIPLREFHDHYDLQKIKIDLEIDFQKKKTPTIDFFIDAFHTLDQYPSNLKKVKSQNLKESNAKFNPNCSIISRSSSCSVLDITHLNESVQTPSCKGKSVSLLNLTKDLEELENLPSVAEICKDFQIFQEQLQQLQLNNMDNRDAEQNYINKLQAINKFAQQLEKLMPQNNDVKFGVSSEDEKRITELVNNIKHANIAQNCENALQQEPICNNDQSLKDILKILSQCLKSLNT